MEDDSLIGFDSNDVRPSCCGTEENSFCWCNSTDTTGLICSSFVNIFILFAATFVAYGIYIEVIGLINGCIILGFCILSLWSHWSTMFGDPGAVPANAHPIAADIMPNSSISVCGRCDAYKPPGAHHDRVSNRCVSRMDHFCPWMNNAIGAKNQKNFLLFLIYTDIAAVYIYVVIALHLVACGVIGCNEFNGVALNFARSLVFVLVFGIIFTSSMIANQIYGIATGLGTIDRMKAKPNEVGTPVPFRDVFGVRWISYILPFDPVFENESKVLRYIVRKEPFKSSA